MTKVHIEGSANGLHSIVKVEVNGHDISNMVTDLRINVEGRGRPEVVAEILPDALNVDFEDADVTLIVPESLPEELVQERFGA